MSYVSIGSPCTYKSGLNNIKRIHEISFYVPPFDETNRIMFNEILDPEFKSKQIDVPLYVNGIKKIVPISIHKIISSPASRDKKQYRYYRLSCENKERTLVIIQDSKSKYKCSYWWHFEEDRVFTGTKIREEAVNMTYVGIQFLKGIKYMKGRFKPLSKSASEAMNKTLDFGEQIVVVAASKALSDVTPRITPKTISNKPNNICEKKCLNFTMLGMTFSI